MKVIIEFFTTLGDSLVAIFDFFIGIFRDLGYFVKLIAEMIPVLPAFWTWLPSGLTYILGLTISIYVVLRILGRSD